MWSVVHTFESLLEDDHLRDIAFFREEEAPGVGRIRETAVPSEWFGTPPSSYRPPPLLGEHSADVLAELGYGPAEIERLMALGITAGSPSPGDIAGMQEPGEQERFEQQPV